MLEMVMAGGLVMVPLLACSVVALAIIIERFWTLQRKRIVPDNLVAQVWQWAQSGALDERRVQALRSGSPLGRVLAAGILHRDADRQLMKESIEEVGRLEVFALGRYISVLGTIASISPLLGLLGTVMGMIRIFSAVTKQGVSDPSILAGGISEALITTATGLAVAIPALLFYRYFNRRVEGFVVAMEAEALKLVEALQTRGPRAVDSAA
ncbi:MAG: MotA/TolQ/ExbB proton channel family protein [Gammaproteobacteria bacterium]|nr:MotA/TolQ/ExbB proton channel family protein [Gammaproteobacteria bacterium]